MQRRRLAPRQVRARFAGPRAGVEWKFHDVDLDDALIASTGTITPTVNIIAQGVTESTRIGRKCTLRTIAWRYNLNMVSVTNMATTSVTVRVMMYLDKQANGETATVTDILESDNYQSFNNLSNSGRFKILHDKFVTLHAPSAIAGPSSGEMDKNGTFFKNVSIPIEFSGATGAIAEIRSNNIGVLLHSRINDLVKFDSKIRFRFSDS